MVPQNKGKIFLADERGHNELDWFRSYNTFNFGKYQLDHKTPFGSLCVLNDDTLAPGGNLSMTIEDDFDVILLPIVGAISYSDNHEHKTIIEAGECQVCATPKDTTIQLTNPYDKELVNFLQIWIRKTTLDADTHPHIYSFDINNNKNQLVPINTGSTHSQYAIGKYTGRAESVYKMNKAGNGLFVFVIEGAFEVQYRLLHARDGLALWEAEEVELEALSNDAIILTMEIPL